MKILNLKKMWCQFYQLKYYSYKDHYLFICKIISDYLKVQLIFIHNFNLTQ